MIAFNTRGLLLTKFLGLIIVVACVCYAGVSSFTTLVSIKMQTPFILMPIVQMFVLGAFLLILGSVLSSKTSALESSKKNEDAACL